ncbi:RPL18B, partial [Symbiodinium microadriaticum]
MTKSIKIKMLDAWLVVVLAVVCAPLRAWLVITKDEAVGEYDPAGDPKQHQDGIAAAVTAAVIGDAGDAEDSKPTDAATAWDMPSHEGDVEQSHASNATSRRIPAVVHTSDPDLIDHMQPEDTKSVGMASNSLAPAKRSRSLTQLEKLEVAHRQSLPIERESQRQKVLSASDDECNESQEPPDEDSEYLPSDEGSDCPTDGNVRNRRKVKARRGNPKSASRHRGVKNPQAKSKSKPRPAPSRTKGDLQLRNLQAGVARKPFAMERPSVPASVMP